MKRFLVLIELLLFLQPVMATVNCDHWPSWSRHSCHRLHQIWSQGNNELYFTGYSWHNRYIYDPDRIRRYNELAWGGGMGKGFYDEEGDWHGLAAFAFLDSHKNLEPVAGYAFIKMRQVNPTTRIGAGYSILATQRSDILHGIPFPGVLPWIFLNHRKATFCVTYIPGAHNIGNVVFVFAKWTL